MIENNLPADHPYKLFFANETEEITHIAEKIFDRDFDKARDEILDFEFLSLPRKQTKEPSEKIAQENIKAFRNLAKDMEKDLKTFFLSDGKQILVHLFCIAAHNFVTAHKDEGRRHTRQIGKYGGDHGILSILCVAVRKEIQQLLSH